ELNSFSGNTPVYLGQVNGAGILTGESDTQIIAIGNTMSDAVDTTVNDYGASLITGGGTVSVLSATAVSYIGRTFVASVAVAAPIATISGCTFSGANTQL